MKNISTYCKDSEHIRREVETVNWDFSEKAFLLDTEKKPFNCRKHHWYPGTFVPEIPFSLIEIITKPGAVVLDPFVGIGTTYIQALLLGRRPIGIESCSIANYYLNSLLYLIKNNKSLVQVVSELQNLRWEYKQEKDYISTIEDEKFQEFFPLWYAPKTLNYLCFLRGKVLSSDNNLCKAAFFIAISNMLMKCSSQNKGWGFIADSVRPKQLIEKNATTFFNANINALIKDIQYLSRQIKDPSDIDIKETLFKQSILENINIQQESVDVIITSPPYPNMIDYSQSQKLSYFYWGIPIDDDISMELGSRRNRSKINALTKYEDEMKHTNSILASLIKRDGYICYILPSYNKDMIRKQIMDNITNDLEEKGFDKVVSIGRLLPVIQRSNNQKWASLSSEQITIWKKV